MSVTDFDEEIGREINSRTTDRLTVTLFWRESDDRIMLRVYDDANPTELFETVVLPEEASYAFLHPYAYAPAR